VKNAILLGFACMAAAVMASCAVAPPGSDELQNVLQSRQSIVLIRFIGEAGGKPTEMLQSGVELNFALGDFDTGGETTKPAGFGRSFDEQTKRHGWAFFFLKPGIHYLAVQTTRRTDAFTYLARFKHAPRWRIDVPPDVKSVYAGTLFLRGSAASLLTVERYLRRFDPAASEIINQEQLAAKIFATHLPQLGTPRTVLMSRHTGPVIIQTPPAASTTK